MKHAILIAFLAVFAGTASATITCHNINCRVLDFRTDSAQQFCDQMAIFHIDTLTKSDFKIMVVDDRGQKSWYIAEIYSNGFRKVTGNSSDLNAAFSIDRTTGEGELTMYRRTTGLPLSEFQLSCTERIGSGIWPEI